MIEIVRISKFTLNKNFNPNIMFTKPEIADKWFSTLFPWLLRCEDVFVLTIRVMTTRLYAYLAERYLSFGSKDKFYRVTMITLEI